ncbi:hypothetical protein ACDP63_20245, partial [Paracoccus sp. P2]|uniref:hypothetical protein n=1 Tax=Paracoccus sp. P2 TaxID=3248840 RepID=UPI00391F8E28
GRSAPCQPEDRVRERPVVGTAAAPSTGLAGQQRPDPLSSPVSQRSPAQDRLRLSILNQKRKRLEILG